jgi:DNA polymerase delta subunit 1
LILYGVTKNGNSVLCHVHSFYPYYFVAAPQGFEAPHLVSYQSALNACITEKVPRNRNTGPTVLNVEMVNKQSIYGYNGKTKDLFLKITGNTY